MAQPVYMGHPLRAYLAQSGEAEIMPGGAHDFAYEDEDMESDEGEDAGRARKRRRRGEIDWAAAALAGGAALAIAVRRYAFGVVLAAGAGYPHVRARIHAYAHGLGEPVRLRRVAGEPPPAPAPDQGQDAETWTALAATFDRDQAAAWAECCCLGAVGAFMLGLHELASLILAGALCPYLDAIIPRIQRTADHVLLRLHATLPTVPIHATGGSSLLAHAASLRKEECARWAEACTIAACLPLLFRFYYLSFSILSAGLYPYMDAILPRSFHLLNNGYQRLQAVLPEIPEEKAAEWTKAVLDLGEFLFASMSLHRIDRQHRQALGERFKYDVISSSLLATSLSGPPSSHGRDWHFEPHVPGSGAASESVVASVNSVALISNETSVQLAFGLAAVALYAAVVAHWLLALVLFAGAAYIYVDQDPPTMPQDGLVLALNDLKDLVNASSHWDSTVQEALAHIEHADRQLVFSSPTSPDAPTTALRAALSASLHTARTQCEKVRPLVAALASAGDLSPLTEMYAPPSPALGPGAAMGFAHLQSERRARTTSLPSAAAAKRATWNGSYAALAHAGSPTRSVLRAGAGAAGKRRSEAVLPWAVPLSAPVSPNALGGVAEEGVDTDSPGSPDYFGAHAMQLRQRRRAAGLSVLGLEGVPASAPMSGPSTPQRRTHAHGLGASPTFGSASRLTALPAARHPLALPALRAGLAAALSARRYACAHLLALRLDADADGADTDAGEYWADVRAVVALLTGTFADAGARLGVALDEAARRHAADAVPSRPPSWGAAPPQIGAGFALGFAPGAGTGFAPMPSAGARFAEHVDAIGTALADARAHLDATTAALHDDDADPLAAYEALRRELGFALRECERGRERLRDVLAARAPALLEDEADDDVPPLAPDLGSGSERSSGDLGHVRLLLRTPEAVLLATHPPADDDDDGEGGDDDDDAHAALLRAAGARGLPELVYEAEPEPPAPLRARTTVSREERIRRARAAREQPSPSTKAGPGLWGPGGDVVQELKDVIWKVGERRRQRADEALQAR